MDTTNLASILKVIREHLSGDLYPCQTFFLAAGLKQLFESQNHDLFLSDCYDLERSFPVTRFIEDKVVINDDHETFTRVIAQVWLFDGHLMAFDPNDVHEIWQQFQSRFPQESAQIQTLDQWKLLFEPYFSNPNPVPRPVSRERLEEVMRVIPQKSPLWGVQRKFVRGGTSLSPMDQLEALDERRKKSPTMPSGIPTKYNNELLTPIAYVQGTLGLRCAEDFDDTFILNTELGSTFEDLARDFYRELLLSYIRGEAEPPPGLNLDAIYNLDPDRQIEEEDCLVSVTEPGMTQSGYLSIYWHSPDVVVRFPLLTDKNDPKKIHRLAEIKCGAMRVSPFEGIPAKHVGQVAQGVMAHGTQLTGCDYISMVYKPEKFLRYEPGPNAANQVQITVQSVHFSPLFLRLYSSMTIAFAFLTQCVAICEINYPTRENDDLGRVGCSTDPKDFGEVVQVVVSVCEKARKRVQNAYFESNQHISTEYWTRMVTTPKGEPEIKTLKECHLLMASEMFPQRPDLTKKWHAKRMDRAAIENRCISEREPPLFRSQNYQDWLSPEQKKTLAAAETKERRKLMSKIAAQRKIDAEAEQQAKSGQMKLPFVKVKE